MILKTYLWRKPEDRDYLAPKLQIINKDLLSSSKMKLKKLIEAVSLKDKKVLVQFLDTDNIVQLLEVN
jgi:hypothetical protein